MTLELTRERAAQLAIMGQLLDADRPSTILEAVRGPGRVQIDPTAVVARTEHLVLYSRLGAFERAELERLTYKERKLFEYFAFICPMSDLPIYRHTMDRVRRKQNYWRNYLMRWMEANAGFRRSVLTQLARGPLPSSQIIDSAKNKYVSSGWNKEKNISRMLEGLQSTGEVAIVGRDGQERVWGLGKDWYPKTTKRPAASEVTREVLSRRLASFGIARAKSLGSSFDVPDGWEKALATLVREGKAREVTVQGLRGTFYTSPALLEKKFRGRSAVLSPFDRLIHDRVRARELFDLEYTLEIYVPPAKRRWGYYVLPVLKGDRFVARFDARREPETGTLRVLSLHAEKGSTPEDARTVSREVRGLGRWLGLRTVEYDKVPRGWRRALDA